jgi:hypothetical protein
VNIVGLKREKVLTSVVVCVLISVAGGVEQLVKRLDL